MGIRVHIKARWKKLDVPQLMRAVEIDSKNALQAARGMARSVMIRNIGTQYFDLVQLRALGHPYSQQGTGRPGGLPKGIVNKQSGGFYESFYIRLAYTGTRYSMIVSQTGAERMQGNWLALGTRHMRGRPWQAQLRSDIAKVVRPYLMKTLNTQLRLTVHAFGINSFPKG